MRTHLCLLVFALLLTGCASEREATRKELATMQQELGRMRAENAIMMARIEALEAARKRKSVDVQPNEAALGTDDDRPPLEVLRLRPEPESPSVPPGQTEQEPAPSDEVNQDEPRTLIRSTTRGQVVAQRAVSAAPSKQQPRPRHAPTGSGTAR